MLVQPQTATQLLRNAQPHRLRDHNRGMISTTRPSAATGEAQGPSEVRRMRVLSWNVGHNQGIWQTLEELRSQEQFDVALLQEAIAPTESQVSRGVTPDQLDVKRWRTEISGHPRPWRTAVAWWGPLDVQPIESAPLAQVS